MLPVALAAVCSVTWRRGEGDGVGRASRRRRRPPVMLPPVTTVMPDPVTRPARPGRAGWAAIGDAGSAALPPVIVPLLFRVAPRHELHAAPPRRRCRGAIWSRGRCCRRRPRPIAAGPRRCSYRRYRHRRQRRIRRHRRRRRRRCRRRAAAVPPAPPVAPVLLVVVVMIARGRRRRRRRRRHSRRPRRRHSCRRRRRSPRGPCRRRSAADVGADAAVSAGAARAAAAAAAAGSTGDRPHTAGAARRGRVGRCPRRRHRGQGARAAAAGATRRPGPAQRGPDEKGRGHAKPRCEAGGRPEDASKAPALSSGSRGSPKCLVSCPPSSRRTIDDHRGVMVLPTLRPRGRMPRCTVTGFDRWSGIPNPMPAAAPLGFPLVRSMQSSLHRAIRSHFINGATDRIRRLESARSRRAPADADRSPRADQASPRTKIVRAMRRVGTRRLLSAPQLQFITFEVVTRGRPGVERRLTYVLPYRLRGSQ